jgi:hypothetical protein
MLQQLEGWEQDVAYLEYGGQQQIICFSVVLYFK